MSKELITLLIDQALGFHERHFASHLAAAKYISAHKCDTLAWLVVAIIAKDFPRDPPAIVIFARGNPNRKPRIRGFTQHAWGVVVGVFCQQGVKKFS